MNCHFVISYQLNIVLLMEMTKVMNLPGRIKGEVCQRQRKNRLKLRRLPWSNQHSMLNRDLHWLRINRKNMNEHPTLMRRRRRRRRRRSSRGRDRSNRSRSRARSSLRYRSKGEIGRKCGEKWWWPVMMDSKGVNGVEIALLWVTTASQGDVTIRLLVWYDLICDDPWLVLYLDGLILGAL